MLVGGRTARAPGDSMDFAVLDLQEGGRGDEVLLSITCNIEAVGSGWWPPHELEGAGGGHQLKGGGFPSVSSISLTVLSRDCLEHMVVNTAFFGSATSPPWRKAAEEQ